MASTSEKRPRGRPVGGSQEAVASTIEEWAELQFGPDDIAFQIGLTTEALQRHIATPGSVYGDAFRRGRLRAEAVVARSLYTLAQQGSSPAQRQFLDRIADRTISGERLESLVESEKRRQSAKADREQMEAAKMRGELILVADAMRVYRAVVMTARANLRNLPPRLAAAMQGLDLVAAAAVAVQEIDIALTDLADHPPKITP